ATFDAWHHLVLQTNIGKGAAHHHFMIAAAGTGLIEIGRLYLVLDKGLARRRIDLYRASWRDVIGGDRGQQPAPHARIDNVGERRGVSPHTDEIRRILHVGRLLVPAVGQASFHVDAAPIGVALENVGVFLGKHLFAQRLANDAADLAARRPDVLEEDLL